MFYKSVQATHFQSSACQLVDTQPNMLECFFHRQISRIEQPKIAEPEKKECDKENSTTRMSFIAYHC